MDNFITTEMSIANLIEDLNTTEVTNDSPIEDCNETEIFIEQWPGSYKIFWTVSDFLLPIYYSVFIVLIRENSNKRKVQ